MSTSQPLVRESSRQWQDSARFAAFTEVERRLRAWTTLAKMAPIIRTGQWGLFGKQGVRGCDIQDYIKGTHAWQEYAAYLSSKGYTATLHSVPAMYVNRLCVTIEKKKK